MSDRTDSRAREAVSAMMDGELSELELHRTLKALSDDTELRLKWQRYHIASSAMRRELPSVKIDFSSQIAAAIEREEMYFPRRWYQSLSKVTIAASVAVLAVFGVQQLQPGFSGPAVSDAVVHLAVDDIEAEGPRYQLPSGFEMPHVRTRTVSTAPWQAGPETRGYRSDDNFVGRETHRQIEAYLNGLMMRRSEQAAQISNQRMLPFVRMTQDMTQERDEQ